MTAEPPAVLRICIALPYFSNLEYLETALRSLIAQSDPHWTGIVVDDASPELGAEAVVAALADSRVRYVRNERNLGISANFNRCLELGAANAEIVTVFHADDELEPGYVAAVVDAHRSFPTAAVVAPKVTVVGSSGRPTRTLGDTVKQMMWPRRLPTVLAGDGGLVRLMHGLFLYTPSLSYRVELLPDVRFDQRWRQVQDLDFYARVLLEGGSIALVPDRVYRYRRHDATMTAQNSRSLVRLCEEVAISREVAVAARNKGWRRSARAARLRLTIRLNGLVEASRLAVHGDIGPAWAALRTATSP
ncbi:MAG: glycosyltransferase family 2 protein [Ilumatobacteraceae bacterium]